MKQHDLSRVLHEHAQPPEISHTARMDGLRTRVRKARRRRGVVVTACVVLALLGGVLVTKPSLLDSQPAAPDPFPEYVLSSRVLAQTWGRTPDPLEIGFTPTTTAPEDVTVLFSCAIGDQYLMGNEESLSVVISLDGEEVHRTDCGPGAISTSGGELRKNLRVGKPALVRMTVLGRMTKSPSEATPTPPVDRAPDGIALRLAVGEHVPVTEYPLPPPPKVPVRVDDEVRDDADVVLRADPDDPNRPQKVVIPWRGVSALFVWTGSPGRLRVLIGAETVADLSNYEYSLQGIVNGSGYTSTDLVPGQPVEVAVLPEGAHGDWVVMLKEVD